MALVLVIEDEQIIREEVLEWLQFEDFDVLGAANGREGVQLALQNLPDLVVTDIMMPEMDGYRVLLELRTHASTALLPVIFMTALAEHSQVRHGMELGADDYLTKPFTSKELVEAVRARLGKQTQLKRQSEQELSTLRQQIIHALPNELRTHLVGILGFAEILSLDSASLSSEQVADFGRVIFEEGQALLRLSENYILYAQLELNEASSLLDGSLKNPADVIQKICSKLGVQYNRNKDISIKASNVPLKISEKDFEKAVFEIVDNALKFSPSNTQVVISSRIGENTYQLSIQDGGRGIAPENIKRIGAYMQFERTLYEYQGSGLGLTLVKRLVEINGGVFNLESQVGEGTTARLDFPL